MMSLVARRFGVFAVVLAAGCDDGDAHFTTRLASDFAPARHRVSVFGVYKDGRMSSDGWDALAPHLASALGTDRCEVGYNALASESGALASAIDEYARADGPTDDFLAQLAPAAKGDLVLVVTFAGKLPQRLTADAGSKRSPQAPASGGRGGGRGMRGGGRTRGESRGERPLDTNVLDMSASVYSVAQARSVALVAMEYSGASVDEAITKFSTKLAESLPGLLCVGWNWDVKIDPNRIRKAIDE